MQSVGLGRLQSRGLWLTPLVRSLGQGGMFGQVPHSWHGPKGWEGRGLGSLCLALTEQGLGMHDLGDQDPGAQVGRRDLGDFSGLQSLWISGSWQ